MGFRLKTSDGFYFRIQDEKNELEPNSENVRLALGKMVVFRRRQRKIFFKFVRASTKFSLISSVTGKEGPKSLVAGSAPPDSTEFGQFSSSSMGIEGDCSETSLPKITESITRPFNNPKHALGTLQ